MTKQELIEKTLEKEWVMFRTVNGEAHVSCQEDHKTFDIMRRAQYEAWDEATVASYYNDICTAEAEGRNLAREKYIRMMESTDPAGYKVFSVELPEISEHKAALVKELWEKYLEQTLRMRGRYPVLAMGGRPTYASEENGWASLETYQTCELMTYSEKTLEKLLKLTNTLSDRGIDLAFEIQHKTITGMGFRSITDAEITIAKGIIQTQGAMGCCCGRK